MNRNPFLSALALAILACGGASLPAAAHAAGSIAVASRTELVANRRADPQQRIKRLAMLIPADGLPVIGWHDAMSGTINIAKCRNTQCAGPLPTVVLVGLPRAGTGLAMAIGSNGHPVLSYRNEVDMSLQATVCQNADCSTASHSSLLDNRRIGADTSIAVPPDGRPLISFPDLSSASIAVARCADRACSSAQTQVIDWYAAGPDSSIAIGPDQLPGLAFQDQQGALLFARCGALDCSIVTSIHVVDGSAAGAGHEPTLRFAPDGMPVMSYLSGAPRRITFARCDDPSCEASVVTEIDQMGPDGIGVDSPSLALGLDGLPRIAYRRGGAELRLTECHDPACEAGARRVVRGARPGAPGTALAQAADGRLLVAFIDGTVQVRVVR
jgi:hypothetical protein